MFDRRKLLKMLGLGSIVPLTTQDSKAEMIQRGTLSVNELRNRECNEFDRSRALCYNGVWIVIDGPSYMNQSETILNANDACAVPNGRITLSINGHTLGDVQDIRHRLCQIDKDIMYRVGPVVLFQYPEGMSEVKVDTSSFTLINSPDDEFTNLCRIRVEAKFIIDYYHPFSERKYKWCPDSPIK